MIRARDVAFVRKLCGLGLPGQTLAQSLLPALRDVIPAHSAGVFWVDGNAEMTSLYAERLLPPEALAMYYERHYQRRAEGFKLSFLKRAQAEDRVSCHSFTRAEQSTDYFRDVMRELDAYHVLYGILSEGGRPFAQISFYRGVADKPFQKEDVETLRALLRYIGTGLSPTNGADRDDDPAVVVEEQLGVVRSDGEVVSAPQSWLRLLRLAALAQVSPRDALQERAVVHEFVGRICGELLPTHPGAVRPKEFAHDTPWGRFAIRAFPLTDARGRRAEQVGLLIRREEPRSLSLVRGTRVAELSPQQREVAILLAHGKSNREIADELHLSFNTASYHVKQVYARLEVNERTAVAEKLLQLAQAPVAH